MKFNLKKLKKQIEFFNIWRNSGARGIIECVTGFGKTIISIIAIHKMNKKKPNNNTIVVVPNTKLYDDWVNPEEGHIKKFKLKNVEVYIVNTYTQNKSGVNYICDLLILDENLSIDG